MEVRNVETKYNADSRTVEGYATVFESPSENIGWIETIHKGAITEETIKNSDVFAKFNHSDEKVLARCNHGEGSLLLEVDDIGLRYMFEAPMTALGDELLEYLKRGDLKQSSFAFTVSKEEGAERWYKENGIIYRDIYKIDKLYDVSPVFQPAFANTSCSKRFQKVIETSDEIDKQMEIIKKEINDL